VTKQYDRHGVCYQLLENAIIDFVHAFAKTCHGDEFSFLYQRKFLLAL